MAKRKRVSDRSKRTTNILLYGGGGLAAGALLFGPVGAIIGTVVGAAIADDINKGKYGK